MPQITLDRIVSVSLQAALSGLSGANTSALALITADVPIAGANFGTWRIYFSLGAVAADFGSASQTYALAAAVFSQNPNILSAGGYLVIIPQIQANPAQPAVLLSSGPVDLTQLTANNYAFNAAVDGAAAEDLSIGSVDSSSVAAAQASLNSPAVTAAGLVFSVSGTPAAAMVTLATSATGAAAQIVIGSPAAAGLNIAPALGLAGSAGGSAAGVEAIRDAILRTYTQVFYFGIIVSAIVSDTALPAIAALVQAIDKIFFYGEYQSSEIAGIMATLASAGFTNSRGLFYSATASEALVFAAAYAALALSTDFAGSDTVSTMNLKNLAGVPADEGLTETLVTACQNAGADCYPDFGVPKLYCSGANAFFDAVYLGLAFKLAIRVAGFNFLATVSTKIPQTEIGMNGLKGAYRTVCKQFVSNGAFAPGTWRGTTFGDPADFARNISDFGFYIYSAPLALQSQAARTSRTAPLVQIACKSAGAIHSSNVLISVEP